MLEEKSFQEKKKNRSAIFFLRTLIVSVSDCREQVGEFDAENLCQLSSESPEALRSLQPSNLRGRTSKKEKEIEKSKRREKESDE